jgi:hypothetical protein
METQKLLMVVFISLTGGVAGYALFEWLRRRTHVAKLGSYLLMVAAAAIAAANWWGEHSWLAGLSASVLLFTAVVMLTRARQARE